VRRVNTDFPLLLIALLLSAFGVAMVYSAGQTDVPTFVSRLWKSQIVWLAMGVSVAYLVSRSSVRVIEWVTPAAYAFTILLLVAVLVPGLGSGAGTAASVKGWLTIAGKRLGQPAELAKITVVLMLAKVLASRREAPRSLLELWKPAIVVGIPWILIMMQPDLGTGIVFIGIFFAMLYWSGVSWPLLVLVASPAISLVLAFRTDVWGVWFVALVILLIRYRPYPLEGVLLGLANVAMGVLAPIMWERLAPYQSQVAIGSGGWFGKGFTLGTQKRLAFLPAQHTDFIFAVVGEELGFIGVTLALALFLLLFLRALRVAERGSDAFSSLIAFGLAASWFVHVFVNVGMTLNLMPITGIPLPFFSYGGSFMLASWLAIGVLMRISSEGRGRAEGLAV
jgi:rod shape determining protein RodA